MRQNHKPSDRHLVRGRVAHETSPLIINLGRGDVLVVERSWADSIGTLVSSNKVAVVALIECGE